MSEDSSTGCNTKEYKVLLKAYADISRAIQCPLTLSGELLATGLMAPALHKNMSDYKDEERRYHIMKTILNKVEEKCENFYSFITILEKDPSMNTITQRLRSECGIGNTKTPPVSCSPLASIPSHPLMKFSQHLRSIYSHPTSMHRKWPPVPNMPFISLATVKKKRPTSCSEVNEHAMFAAQGRIDEIPSQPFRLEDVLKINENKFLRCILVEGAPGIGKSTFTWELCHQWDKIPDLKQYDLILLVPLKEAAVQKPSTWKDLILFQHPSVEAVQNHIESNDGAGVLWILDGFDELSPDDREEGSLYMKLINGRVLPSSTVIVTSRSSVAGCLQRSGQIDRHLELLGFTSETILEYVKSYFRERRDMLLSFIICHVLQSNLELMKLMYIPLNAAVVCLLHEENYGGTSFQTLTELYNCLTCALIKRHLDIEEIPQLFCERDIQKYLPSEFQSKFLNMLEMAHDGVLGQKFVFTCLEENYNHLGLMNGVVSSRLAISVNKCSFYFLHLSLQEYLAALHHVMTRSRLDENFGPATVNFILGIASRYNQKMIPSTVKFIKDNVNLENSFEEPFNPDRYLDCEWNHLLLDIFMELDPLPNLIKPDLHLRLSHFSPDYYFKFAALMVSKYPMQLSLSLTNLRSLLNFANNLCLQNPAGKIVDMWICFYLSSSSFGFHHLKKIISSSVVKSVKVPIQNKEDIHELFCNTKPIRNLQEIVIFAVNKPLKYSIFNILDKITDLEELTMFSSIAVIDEQSLNIFEKIIKERQTLKSISVIPSRESTAMLNRFLSLVFGPSSLNDVTLRYVNFECCSDEVVNLLTSNTNIKKLHFCSCRITKRLTHAILKNSSIEKVYISIVDHYQNIPNLLPEYPTDNSEVPGLIELVKTCSPPLNDIVLHRVFTSEESIEIVLGALCNENLHCLGIYDVTMKCYTNALDRYCHSELQHNNKGTEKIDVCPIFNDIKMMTLLYLFSTLPLKDIANSLFQL